MLYNFLAGLAVEEKREFVANRGGLEFIFAALKGIVSVDQNQIIEAGDTDFREDSAEVNKQLVALAHDLVRTDDGVNH